jgi:hypothetical protein
MNRRGFLGTMVSGVALGAAARTWPFRVFSFPTDVPQTFLAGEPLIVEAPKPIVMVRHRGYSTAQFNICGGDLGRGSGSTYLRVDNPKDVPMYEKQGYKIA